MDVVRRVRTAASRGLEIENGEGSTSFRPVKRQKVKTGHAGTLDPLASGVVICCLGRATKAVDQLMGLTKVYLTTFDLSAFTSTDDREGERQEVETSKLPSLSEIKSACGSFLGEIQQVPPAFSAIHVKGKRAYQLARQGEEVSLGQRTVRIDAIEVLAYDWPNLTLRVTCGKGTYIRSLGRDIGKALGVGGHLASLRRESVGPYHVDQAMPIERFEQPFGPSMWLPFTVSRF